MHPLHCSGTKQYSYQIKTERNEMIFLFSFFTTALRLVVYRDGVENGCSLPSQETLPHSFSPTNPLLKV